MKVEGAGYKVESVGVCVSRCTCVSVCVCVCGCELGLCGNYFMQIVKPLKAAAYVYACG